LGFTFPYSDIDKYLKMLDSKIGCIADTSFLIAITDEDHVFHDDSKFIFEKLAAYRIPIYVTVTARSEFIDFHRRVIMTETLMDILSPSSNCKISSSVRETLRSQKGWIDNQARLGNDPYLSDSRLKNCKRLFLPKTQSGQIGWVELCKDRLAGRLLTAWESIVEALSLNYIEMRTEDIKTIFNKELSWENMYKFAEESALGSNDAMILNLLDSSNFPFVITSDYDLAYGTILSTENKTALVPDNIYRNHIKKLKFL
jgi:predicted nucleic acid-binding protein